MIPTDYNEVLKQKLIDLGWSCSLCSCPGQKGYDCATSKFRGVIIQQRGNNFKIFRNGLVIESAFVYQLNDKLTIHGLI